MSDHSEREPMHQLLFRTDAKKVFGTAVDTCGTIFDIGLIPVLVWQVFEGQHDYWIAFETISVHFVLSTLNFTAIVKRIREML
jgi:hypothetical protein